MRWNNESDSDEFTWRDSDWRHSAFADALQKQNASDHVFDSLGSGVVAAVVPLFHSVTVQRIVPDWEAGSMGEL